MIEVGVADQELKDEGLEAHQPVTQIYNFRGKIEGLEAHDLVFPHSDSFSISRDSVEVIFKELLASVA